MHTSELVGRPEALVARQRAAPHRDPSYSSQGIEERITQANIADLRPRRRWECNLGDEREIRGEMQREAFNLKDSPPQSLLQDSVAGVRPRRLWECNMGDAREISGAMERDACNLKDSPAQSLLQDFQVDPSDVARAHVPFQHDTFRDEIELRKKSALSLDKELQRVRSGHTYPRSTEDDVKLAVPTQRHIELTSNPLFSQWHDSEVIVEAVDRGLASNVRELEQVVSSVVGGRSYEHFALTLNACSTSGARDQYAAPSMSHSGLIFSSLM
mmetsp:Transcript_23985/g.73456  ORF Transcript_23985/g.73456 Transcript_23985/m.73456 type:complete len:271 (+) Transcript_23985:434-1246(+)|eukprot:scaffold286586_cov39-Tisochrysis_lutea.AAC.2